MLGNVVGLVVLAGVVFLFGWLARRAWRSRSRPARWLAAPLACLLAVLLALVGLVSAYGLYRYATPRSLPAASFSTTGDRARGEHLAAVVCATCHSPSATLPLTGGNNLALDTGLPLGNLYPTNLTPAGSVANWSDADIARAVRYAVGPGGQTLLMPVFGIRNLSDQDLGDIIAYLRAQRPVATQTPENYPSLLLGLLVGAGLFNVDYPALPQPVVAPAKAVTPAYGAYLVDATDCRGCHGDNLDGQVSPPFPPGPNLTAVRDWSAAQFVHAMRTGVLPNGRPMQPPMPWPTIGKLDDTELAAMHVYLASLPVR